MKNSISIQTSDPYTHTHQIHGPITIILIFFPGSKAENVDKSACKRKCIDYRSNQIDEKNILLSLKLLR